MVRHAGCGEAWLGRCHPRQSGDKLTFPYQHVSAQCHKPRVASRRSYLEPVAPANGWLLGQQLALSMISKPIPYSSRCWVRRWQTTAWLTWSLSARAYLPQKPRPADVFDAAESS